MHDSIDMKYPEYTNPLRQRANYWCQGLERKGIGRNYFIGMEFPFGMMKKFWNQTVWWLHNTVNVLKPPNCILKWWILCFMYLMHTRELVLLNYVPALPPAPCLVRMPAGVDFWLWPMAWASWTLSTKSRYCVSEFQVSDPQSGPGASTLTLGPSDHLLPQYTIKRMWSSLQYDIAAKSVWSFKYICQYSLFYYFAHDFKN